jgi:hypothetical protein
MLLLEDYEIETLFCDLIFLACKYFVDKRITTDGDYTFSLQGFANVSFTYDFDEIFVDDEEKECWI